MVPQQILQEIEALSADYSIEVCEDGGVINLVFDTYSIPGGFSMSETSLLLRLPASYPNGKPDMFWTEPELTLADGRVPRQADQIQSFLGKSWRRFSWHLSQWNPGRDNLYTYLEFVNMRLAKEV